MSLSLLHNFLSIAIELSVLFFVITFGVNFLERYIPYSKMQILLNEYHPAIAAYLPLHLHSLHRFVPALQFRLSYLF